MCFPSDDRDQIIAWQEETAEIVSMIAVGEQIPLGGIRDLTDILKKLRIHQVLEAGDFLDIERSLYAAKNLNAFFRAKKSGYILVRMASTATPLSRTTICARASTAPSARTATCSIAPPPSLVASARSWRA